MRVWGGWGWGFGVWSTLPQEDAGLEPAGRVCVEHHLQVMGSRVHKYPFVWPLKVPDSVSF